MINTELNQQLVKLIEQAITEISVPSQPESLYEPYSYAMGMGGKRIRPYLTLLANGLCGGDIKDAMPSALAVEILHNFTLVHDDIMDRAETRRGKPSVFSKWDENTAILSGDVMFADAFRQLQYYASNNSYSKEEYSAILEAFTTSTIVVCEGQALDMDFVNRIDVTHGEYIEMIKGKTSALLGGALKMGAISAHAKPSQVDSLFNFGIELGIAFQIQDDLLDATADPEKFGKKAGGDIYEGKKTYLTILTLERANATQKSFIEAVLANSNATELDVSKVLKEMENLNVLSDIAKEVDKHYEKALQYLDIFTDSDYKQELKNLLTFLKNRDH